MKDLIGIPQIAKNWNRDYKLKAPRLAAAFSLTLIALSAGMPYGSPSSAVKASDGPAEDGQVSPERVKSGPVKPFIFTATTANDIGNNFAIIEDPALDGNPNAIIEVTQNWNPGEQGGTYNDHNVGVFYFAQQHWAVFNQDHTPIPVGASFNVAVAASGFIVTASASNVSDGRLVIDNAATNNKPTALLQVTANWSNSTQVYNDHAFSVSYKDNMWGIFNVDGTPIPDGALFNVWVTPFGFVHTATAANCFNDFTVLNDPSVDGNFNPIILSTPDFGSGELGIIDKHTTGVFAGSPSAGAAPNWAIFNQDTTAIPVGTSFNVTAFNPPVIQSITITGKKMFVTGINFNAGAILMINGVTTPTASDPANPSTSLICKKGGKLVQPGATATLQVLDANTVLSAEFSYQRPASEE